MTNIKATKRALGSSVLALFLCFAMLLGTTFAWFTDSVTSANNIITAGNLDVELEYKKVVDNVTDTNWTTVADGALFNDTTIWEPGHVEVVYLKVSNVGTLDLKYQLNINVADFRVGLNADGDEIDLRDYLVFKVVEIDETAVGTYTRENAVNADADEIGLKDYNGETTTLESEDVDYVALIVYMPETVGNEANYRGDADTAPMINLGVNLFATQVATEEDSFGPDYDADAPIVSNPVTLPSGGTESVKFDVVANETPVSVELPASVATALVAAGYTEASLAVSVPEIVGNTVTFESIEIVDKDGKVVELGELGLTEKITVTLPAQTQFAGSAVAVYHDGVVVAMVNVGADGVISYEVEHLCEVQVVKVEDPAVNETTGYVEIGTVAELFGFASLVNSGNDFAGKTVVLTADIDLNNMPWAPIGNVTFNRDGDGSYVVHNAFKGTFDGQGHTISNLKIDTEANGVGLFGAIIGATIKNVNIKNVDIVADGTAAALVGYCLSYTNTSTIENCHVSGNISIVADWAYVGGVAAYGHANISGCSVIAEGTGTLTSENRNAVAGIIGWNYGASVTDCHVKNLNLTGWANIGGIEGYVPGGHTISGCSAENVVITKTRLDGIASIGLASGGWSYNAKNAITITNNTFKNVEFNGTAVSSGVSADILYGSEYYGTEQANFVAENNTTDGIVNNVVYMDKKVSDGLLVKDGVYYVYNATGLQAAVAIDDAEIYFLSDITGDITVTQKPDVKVTIDGKDYNFSGVILVDGKSGTYTTAGLTIKNVNFVAESISADACIRLGNGTNATRYTCNVTVENCTFDVPGAVGVKSYTGGDKNVTIEGCTATANAHSLAQLKGVDGVLVDECKVYSKNGINFNNSTNVTVKNSTVDVKGYAVRFGESSGGVGAAETYTITNCTLKSACDDGDAVIVLRGTADNATLKVVKTTIEGAIELTNTAKGAKVYLDGALLVSDTTELQAAINSGESNILLGKGEYTADLYNIDARDSLTITGQGADTKIKFANLQVRASQFKNLTINKCTIERMPDKAWGHLVFGSSATAGGEYTISNCIFNGVSSQGIFINQTVEATFNIENCTFNGDFGGEGAITIQNNDGVDITVNVTGCDFNNIPATSHEMFLHYAYDGLTLNADGVNVCWKVNQ